MTIGEMFGQSAGLALIGMCVVFGFLALLVVCITITGRIIRALGLDKETAVAAAKPAAANVVRDEAVIAAIGAALHQYRNGK